MSVTQPLPLEGCGLVLERGGQSPRLSTIETLPPGRGQVRVKMTAAGVCHTDIAAIRDARTTPLLLGHEGVGVIESVGPGVSPQRSGERVLLSWRTPCGACSRCQRAQPHLCHAPKSVAAGAQRQGRPLARLLDTGCFATHVVMHAEAAVPIPDGIADHTAALVGCAVSTGVGAVVRTARVRPGEDVAVWGAGGVGLNVVTGAARIARARTVLAIDPDPRRRDAAAARGATATAAPEVALTAIHEATSGRGVDHAFEVVGAAEIMRLALDGLAVGGQLTLVGAAARDAELSFHPRLFMSRQQRLVGCIYGSLRPSADLPLLLDWCATGVLPLDDLSGERVALQDLPDLFTRPARGIRPVVQFP